MVRGKALVGDHADLSTVGAPVSAVRGAHVKHQAAHIAEGQRMFYGTHPRMLAYRATLPKIAECDVPVLIQGETGTGKEILARHLHLLSSRAAKPFIKLNCAAVPSELAESEMFGYERGAFTGAYRRKPGIFELANGGTVMLDEIGDMEFRLQAKLLQVLQDQEFRRVGGTETVHVDVRVISASHRDLRQSGGENRFRTDLFYRLNGFSLTIPALRERPDDILPLAEYLYRRHNGPGAMPTSSALETALLAYPWPGNVRELETMIRKLIVMQDPCLVVSELHAHSISSDAGADSILKSFAAMHATQKPHGVLPENANSRISVIERASQTKEQVEAAAIRSALTETRWNRKQAAAILKLDYKALLYKMKKLGIE